MTKRWHLRTAPPPEFFAQFPDIPRPTAALLYHRNIRTDAAMDEFLRPDYARHVHDPFLFRDMEKAVARIFRAQDDDARITVHGDYDADGVSASAILGSVFAALGIRFDVFLPHRETDGYGLNSRTVDMLAARGTSLIITCDCGISNGQDIERAAACGIDVIVTDHHAIPPALPPAYAILHPKVEGETYPDKTLAGGGVAFKLAQGILRKHHETHERLPNGERHDAFEKWLLDLVAIASVADMVPLLGESRTLTHYGLKVLNKTRRLGLQHLLAGLWRGKEKKPVTADTISWQIAPRINAAGRMEHATVAYNLLMANDAIAAADLAMALQKNNTERQRVTETTAAAAIEQVDSAQRDWPVLFAVGDDWSLGIVGLIASKLKERYQKPAFVMARASAVVGSGRSVRGFDMVSAMHRMPECFAKFGGHPMACGFTLKTPDTIPLFQKKMIAAYRGIMGDAGDAAGALDIDADITLSDITWGLYEMLDAFEPFGKDNEKPRYIAHGVTVVRCDGVGADKKHLRLAVKDEQSRPFKAVGWNLCGKKKEDNWCELLAPGDRADLVFEIDANEWQGNRELQLTIVDLKKI